MIDKKLPAVNPEPVVRRYERTEKCDLLWHKLNRLCPGCKEVAS